MSAIHTWKELYDLLEESYKDAMKMSEDMKECFGCCKEDKDMEEKKTCMCQQEAKEFCIIYRIKDGEEKHTIIEAKNVEEAVRTFRNMVRAFCDLASVDIDYTDIFITRVFDHEV